MAAIFNTGLPATEGLSLQCCDLCQHINYPRRELCGNCLGDSLSWKSVDSSGTVLSFTELHYPLEDNFSAHLPWCIASIELDSGPVAFTHIQAGLSCEDRVNVVIARDQSGNCMLIATPINQSAAQWLGSIGFTETSS